MGTLLGVLSWHDNIMQVIAACDFKYALHFPSVNIQWNELSVHFALFPFFWKKYTPMLIKVQQLISE